MINKNVEDVKIKSKNYETFLKKNKDYLEKHYEISIKHSKDLLKENYEYFKIDFNFFCFMVWKARLNINAGDVFTPYMQFNGIFDLSNKISDFIKEYASEIIDIGKSDEKEYWKILQYSNSKDFYRTFYYIYAAMLGVESHYFDKVFETIKGSKFFEDLSKKQKKELDTLMNKLKKFEPESKSNEDLIKSFFKIAININDIPTLDQLENSFCSRSKWQRKLKELDFLYKLNYECEKRLKKKLTVKNKNLLVRIKNEILDKLKKVGLSESSKTGVTKKTKPNFDETFSDNENDYEY